MERRAAAVVLTDVVKTYTRGTERIPALRGVSLTVDAGERVAVAGRSGAGKSTLLHVVAGLERPP